ncbi:hypothetical protein RCL1_007325 [Eukaryota sp. TZLM3-RCL]
MTPFSLIYGIDISPRRNLLESLQTLSKPLHRYENLTSHASAVQYLTDLSQRIQDKWQLALSNQSNSLEDKNPITCPVFKVGDFVFRRSHKINKLHGHPGPFEIVSKVGSSRYQVKNLINSQEFIASAYDLILCNTNEKKNGREHLRQIAATDLEEYVVDSIISHNKVDGKLLFEVRWEDGDVTYEPSEHLKGNDIFIKYVKSNKINLREKRKK